MDTLESLVRDRGTVEYLAYDFTTMTVNGETVAPPATYQVGLTRMGSQPVEGDWHDAPWLAGPLTQGDYVMRLRFTDTPEIPMRTVATITVP